MHACPRRGRIVTAEIAAGLRRTDAVARGSDIGVFGCENTAKDNAAAPDPVRPRGISDSCLRGSLRAAAPGVQEGGQVGRAHRTVAVEVLGRGRGAPGVEQARQIGGAHRAIGIEVGGAVATTATAGRDRGELVATESVAGGDWRILAPPGMGNFAAAIVPAP